jgi:AraC family transcriptional regulator
VDIGARRWISENGVFQILRRQVLANRNSEKVDDFIGMRADQKLVRLSPYHFCRAFKRSFGVPPLRYQRDRRIQHAKRLLADSELSVTDVAVEIGFGSSTSFATAFRKATGLSPTTYSRSL